MSSNKTANYRISYTYIELTTLRNALQTAKQETGICRTLTSVLTKVNVAIAKIEGESLTPAHITSNVPRSLAGKLTAIDPDTYLMEYGNPEEKVAVEAAMMHLIETGEIKSWQECMPPVGERKYPATELPGMQASKIDFVSSISSISSITTDGELNL